MFLFTKSHAPWPNITNWKTIVEVMYWSLVCRQTSLGKQTCRPRSGSSWRKSLIKVYIVCHSVCIFWTHYSMVKQHCSNSSIITAIFWVSDFFQILTEIYLHMTMSVDSSPCNGTLGFTMGFSSFFSGLSASGFFFFLGIPASHRFFLPVGVRLLFSCIGGALILDRVELSELVTGAGVVLLRGLELVVLLLAVLAVEFFRGRLTFTPWNRQSQLQYLNKYMKLSALSRENMSLGFVTR